MGLLTKGGGDLKPKILQQNYLRKSVKEYTRKILQGLKMSQNTDNAKALTIGP